LWHRSLFPGLKFGQGISSVARVVLELVRRFVRSVALELITS